MENNQKRKHFNVICQDEHDCTLYAKRVFTVPRATRIDEPVANLKYIGDAPVGSSPSEATWKIQKYVKSGTETIITYADGNDNYDNIWNDRTELTYS